MKRSTLIALAVLAALAAYIYVYEREPIEDADRERVFDVDEAAVSRIELQNGDEERIVMERDGEAWRLLEPVDAGADATEADLLVQNVATLGFERAVASAAESDLGDYGLDEPSLRVRFTTEDGAEHGLDFGADTPTGSNQYARRAGGDDVFVLPSYLVHNFRKTAWDLRDKAIFDVPESAEATRIVIDRGETAVVLARENGAWRLVEPFAARADRFESTDLVSAFRQAEMEGIASETDEDPEAFGLEEPGIELRIEFPEDVGPLVLEVGDARELEYFARTPSRPQIFLIDQTLVSDLQRDPRELVSKKLLDASTFQVTRLGIDDRAFEKRKEGEEESWVQIEPEEAPVDAKAVEDLLFELSGARADEVLLEIPAGVEDPAHAITVWAEGMPDGQRLRVAEPAGGRVVAHREGDDVALALAEETWEAIARLLSLESESGGELEN